MEINERLLAEIFKGQNKAWELLERWLQSVEGDTEWGRLKVETEEYLKPIRAGLAKISKQVQESNKIKVIKPIPKIGQKE